MNTELLERIAVQIEAKPEEYNQASWCGTACCIAGHALLLSGLNPFDAFDVDDKARELLGLNYDQAIRLFICAPDTIKELDEAMWHGETPEIRAKAGVARIRHFIKTKGRE